MAIRPIFVPMIDGRPGALEKPVDFKWYAGLAKSQKQKSVHELHSAARKMGYERVLEISSKSEVELGIKLSAFNLVIETKSGNRFTVETAFQGSKVFKRGGPFRDLLGLDSLSAKRDIRLKESGSLIGFDFFGKSFPLEPRTYFYDWIYINALVKKDELARAVRSFNAFTDIEFNPAKSINCQAHAVAIYVSLFRNGALLEALSSPDAYLKVLSEHYLLQKRNVEVQDTLI